MPSNNNLVRDIVPSSGHRLTMRTSPKRAATKQLKPDFAPPKKEKQRSDSISGAKSGKGRLKFITAAVILYAAALFAVGFFAKAEVNLYLKKEIFDVKKTVSAGVSNSEIKAEAVIFDEQKSGTSVTSERKNFSERASGTVVIYNAYSSEPQALIANTRFESADGKIYRITKPLIVPGAKIIDGKIEPSSVETGVLAEEAGEAYNISLSDFTIPGFKGTPKYDKFYARSKTPMSGGFVGEAKVITEKEVQALRQKLEEDLREALFAKMNSELPEGFFMPDGAYKYEAEIRPDAPKIGSKADELGLTVSGRLTALFVREDDVKRKILEPYKDDPDFKNMDVVNFGSIQISAQDTDFKTLGLRLAISGRPEAVWNVDIGTLAEKLALASSSSERANIFQQYPQIRQASIVYRPFWWAVFPKEADKIIIFSLY